MNLLLQMTGSPLALRIGWMLLHSLWQGALVGIFFGLSRLILRRSSANARYIAGCLAIALLPAAALLTLLGGVSSGSSVPTPFDSSPAAFVSTGVVSSLG